MPTKRDIEAWYVARFPYAARDRVPGSVGVLPSLRASHDEEADGTARSIWATINGVNLRENILGTRERARLVLEKGPDHAVRRVRLRVI